MSNVPLPDGTLISDAKTFYQTKQENREKKRKRNKNWNIKAKEQDEIK